jgi:23S rRNA (uracil1939-C5)-methyltransferase
MKKGDIVTLNIEKLSFGGNGVSKDLDIVGFVSNTAPGDKVKARISKLKKRFFEAELIEVLEASSQRRLPPCPIANQCGGCQWQHINYEEQLKQKHLILKEMFERVSFLKDLRLPPLLHAEEFRYRNRIQIRRKNHQLGFLQKGSHRIVPVDDCLIADEKISSQFMELKKEKNQRPTDKIELYLDQQENIKSILNESHGALDGFSQVNNKLNKEMQDWVLTKIKTLQPESFFDLYAGNANFARFIEEKYPLPITAMEWSKAAIAKAKELAQKDSQIQWIQGKIEDQLEQLNPDETTLVLIDPPRIGCDENVIRSLAEANFRDLLYISCNPTTFIRDLQRMEEYRKFEVLELQGLDMFPQTYHIELMAHIRLEN